MIKNINLARETQPQRPGKSRSSKNLSAKSAVCFRPRYRRRPRNRTCRFFRDRPGVFRVSAVNRLFSALTIFLPPFFCPAVFSPHSRKIFKIVRHRQPANNARGRRPRLAAVKTGFDMRIPFNELNRAFDLGFKFLPWGDDG
jgi:hypothetical protein